MADDDYESDEGQDEPSPRDLRHQLAERAREAEELRAQLEATRREAEFTKALGDNANAPWAQYFTKGYDGEINAEAIRKAATEAGFLNFNANTPPTDDLSGHARMAQASAGGDPATRMEWRDALQEADRISNPEEREAAILSVVERFGGVTSRTAQ